MSKITSIINGDSGLSARTKMNDALKDLTGESVGNLDDVDLSEPATTGQALIWDGSAFVPTEVAAAGIEEAPEDGKQYARQDKDWTEVAAGGATQSTIMMKQVGELSVTTGTARWYPPYDCTVVKVEAWADESPVGSDIIAAVNINNVLMQTIQIPDGQFVATPEVVESPVLATEYITVDITQVGNTTSGKNLYLRLTY